MLSERNVRYNKPRKVVLLIIHLSYKLKQILLKNFIDMVWVNKEIKNKEENQQI